jgi:GTP-dependent dephospho-CoA kinase
MSVNYVVTPEVLSKFQKPFGALIKGTAAQTMTQLKDNLKTEKPTKIISVGDTVSRNLSKHQIPTQLVITDNKSHRRNLKPLLFPNKTAVKIRNPQGTITKEAMVAVKEALDSTKEVHLLVEGEEDLLTLIAVLYAPENAWVIYGQPHKGVVVVKVTSEKRAEAERIFKEMKTVKKKT